MSIEKMSDNLKLTEVTNYHEIDTNADILDRAKECAEILGSTPQGLVTFREYLLSLIPVERRTATELNPDTTRVAIGLFNIGLKKAGIEDEIVLHYHYTSAENAEKILQTGGLGAVGKSAMQQIETAYTEKGLSEAFNAFMKADNWERTAIHVAGKTKPEEVRPNYTSIPNLFEQRLRAWVGKSHSLGIPSKNLAYYFEIVTAKSDKMFKPTVQSKTPFFDLDEQYCVLDELDLALDEGSKYAVLGPYANSRLLNDTQDVVSLGGL